MGRDSTTNRTNRREWRPWPLAGTRPTCHAPTLSASGEDQRPGTTRTRYSPPLAAYCKTTNGMHIPTARSCHERLPRRPLVDPRQMCRPKPQPLLPPTRRPPPPNPNLPHLPRPTTLHPIRATRRRPRTLGRHHPTNPPASPTPTMQPMRTTPHPHPTSHATNPTQTAVALHNLRQGRMTDDDR